MVQWLLIESFEQTGKIVGIARDEGGLRAAVPMPFAGLLHDRFLTASARGLGEIDWSGIARLVAESAGFPT